MLTIPEIQLLMTIITEWQDRTPMKVFALGRGADLQSTLVKLQQMAAESDPKKEADSEAE